MSVSSTTKGTRAGSHSSIRAALFPTALPHRSLRVGQYWAARSTVAMDPETRVVAEATVERPARSTTTVRWPERGPPRS